MPYSVKQAASGECPDSKPWAVVKQDDGKVVPGGCHETREDAVAHLAALYLVPSLLALLGFPRADDQHGYSSLVALSTPTQAEAARHGARRAVVSRGSWRVAPLPSDWEETRVRILQRDEYRCYLCRGFATEVDHVVPTSQGGGEDDLNLRAICRPCHRTKTGREGQAARIPRKRPVEAHPGLLS